MEENSILQIPEITPFQFSEKESDYGNTVNLFRGDVNFFVPLVSLVGRNGLDVHISALYRGNVSRQVRAQNQESPTSILGLGWYLPIDYIEVDTRQTATDEDNRYYFYKNGSKNRLYRNNRRWKRGSLSDGFIEDLDHASLGVEFKVAFGEESVRLSDKAYVEVMEQGGKWMVIDPEIEILYELERDCTGNIIIYDGGCSFEMQGYDYSRIRYYKCFEKWEITQTDGITSVFGGNVVKDMDSYSSVRESIVWGVRNGNWPAVGSVPFDKISGKRLQEQYVRAWKLSECYTPEDDHAFFEYEQVVQSVQVGGLRYTKACYLSRIIDVFGRTVVFTYAEKTYDNHSTDGIREYSDPYKDVPDNQPDAYQSCYETRYLQTLNVINKEGIPLFGFDFQYDLQRFTPISENEKMLNLYGDTYKRILVSVRKTISEGHVLPDVRFSYYMEGSENPGSIRTICYMDGCVVEYVYAHKELVNCDLDLKLYAPVYNAVPRVWLKADYAVVMWYMDGLLSWAVYTWIGRWQKWTSRESEIHDWIDIESLDCLLEDDFFVFHYQTLDKKVHRFYPFHADGQILGAWKEIENGYIEYGAGECSIVGSDDFFAIENLRDTSISVCNWDELAQEWKMNDLLEYVPAPDPEYSDVYMVASGNCLFITVYDRLGMPGLKNSYQKLYYLDELNKWKIGSQRSCSDMVIESLNDQGLIYSAMPWGIAATYVTEIQDGQICYELAIYTWDTKENEKYILDEPVIKKYELSKTTQGRVVSIDYAPHCTFEGLIVCGGHLLRFNGEKWLENDSLLIEGIIDDEDIFWLTAGNDCVVKTENTTNHILGKVQVFDPNLDVDNWRSDSYILSSEYCSEPVVTRYFPSISNKWLTWDNLVYYQGKDSGWKGSFLYPLYQLQENIDSVTLLNNAPRYMIYARKEKEGEKNVGTDILNFENGILRSFTCLDESFFSMVNPDGSFVESINGKLPGNESVFISYLPMEKDFDHAESISLHKVLGDQVCDRIVCHPATKVIIHDGFRIKEFFYDFDVRYAVCDFNGEIAKFHQVGIVEGEEKENGKTVYTFYNSLNGFSTEINMTQSSYLDGTLKEKLVYDNECKLVASTKYTYEVVTSVTDVSAMGKSIPLWGAIVRLSKMTVDQDGVCSWKMFQYQDACGEICCQITSSVNSEGKEEIYKDLTLFAFEKYEKLGHLNLLSKSAQTKMTVRTDDGNEFVRSAEAWTYRMYAVGEEGRSLKIPASYEMFKWVGDSSFYDFNMEEEEVAGWQKKYSIKACSRYGTVLEYEAPIGKRQSILYDRQEGIKVAVFSLASIQDEEGFYFGFEPYEKQDKWLIEKDGVKVVEDVSFTGTRSLCVQSRKEGDGLCLSPNIKSRNYLFSCYMRCPSSGNGTAGWRVVYIENKTEILDQELIGADVREGWQYLYYQVKLNRYIDKGQVSVIFYPFNDMDNPCFIDHVLFCPYENPAMISVYDPIQYKVVANLGPYNSINRVSYDALGKVSVMYDKYENVSKISAYYLSRQSRNGFFSSELPNSIIDFQPMGDTFYDRFYDNKLSDCWRIEDGSEWKTEKGLLVCEGNTDKSAITLADDRFVSNFVVHLSLVNVGERLVNIGMKVGEDFTVEWSDNKWILSDSKNRKLLINDKGLTKGMGCEWILALNRSVVSFWVDGCRIFCYVAEENIQGYWGLYSSATIKLSDFVIGRQPQTGILFFNGMGKKCQGQSLESNKVVITQYLYDSSFRAVGTSLPASIGEEDMDLLSYSDEAVTGIDLNGKMSGLISEALPETNGFPYSWKRFENSPLSRVIEIGAPGEDFAIRPGNDHTVKYSYGSQDNYKKTIRCGVSKERGMAWTNTLGIEVKNMRELSETENIIHSKKLRYTPKGILVTDLLPNYFNPPVGSQADDWVKTIFIDLEERKLWVEEPNSSRQEFMYTLEGQVRFYRDGVLTEKRSVAYCKFDDQNRIVEQGVLRDVTDWNALNDYVERMAWPSLEDGAIPYVRYVYNGDNSSINDLGNLTSILKMDPDIPGKVKLKVNYSYDDRQRLISKKVCVLDEDIELSTHCEYDNLGNVLVIVYPSGFRISYEYDESGRVCGIRDTEGILLASIDYTAGDQVAKETIYVGANPYTTYYQYNTQGWISKISSPYYTEELTYTEGGYGGKGFYDGKIASKRVKLKLPEGVNVPSELLFRYDYDKAGRLCVAECSSDGKILENCSLGLGKPLTYDLNGNFLQVDEETYTYHQGSDFVKNTDGSTRSDYLKDANGATVSAFPRGVKEIVRDLLTGKPSCFKLTDGKELQIVYDDKERRAYKKNPSYIRFYGRDMEGNVLSEMERHSDIGSWQDYLYSPNGLFGVRTKGLLYPIWKDHLKSPQIIGTPEGNVKDCFQYDVFGALIHGDEVKAKNTYDLIRYLFNGYEIDEETGLYDAGARIYDPHLRLFYSKDPKAEYASPYLFLGANPITFADPNGESSWWSILIGAIVGGIVTVATGGIGAVVFGTDIAVSMAVGAVAGVTGSFVGDGVTAGISHEPFSAKRALLDSVTGLAGGAVGAGIGGVTGKIAMRQAFDAGKSCGYVTKIGTATSMITGGVSGAVASSGVAAAMTGQSFFSKETALNVAIGAIAGAGGALMACGAHFGWFGKVMPVEADLGDIESFNCRIDHSSQGDNLLMTIVDNNSYNQTKNAYGSVDQIFNTAGGIGPTDVIALHGVGRFVFPFCNNGNYMRPMSAKNFGHLVDSVFKNRTSPLKLSICFAALPGPFGSVGHTVHSVLNRPVYAGLGVVNPTTLDTRSSWIKF